MSIENIYKEFCDEIANVCNKYNFYFLTTIIHEIPKDAKINYVPFNDHYDYIRPSFRFYAPSISPSPQR